MAVLSRPSGGLHRRCEPSVFPDANPALPSRMTTGRRDYAVRFQRTVRLTLQLVDMLLLLLAFTVAYYLRYDLGIGGDVADENQVPIDTYLPLMFGSALGFFVIARMSGLHHNALRKPVLDEVWSVILSVSFTITLLFGVVFLFRGLAYSRGLFLMAWAITMLLLVSDRLVGRTLLAILRQRGIGVERVLVVGGGRLAQTVMHVLTTQPGLSYRLVGFLHTTDTGDLGRFKSLGTVDDLEGPVQLHEVDQVIIALTGEEHVRASAIAERCVDIGVDFRLVPDFHDLSMSRGLVDVTELGGIPVIGPRLNMIGGGNLLMKRALDIAGAGTALLIFGIPWLIICLLIKLDSKGPVFFVQTRVGKNHQTFPARKFRSMYVDAEQRLASLQAQNEATGPLFKMRNDPRVTRVGRWLRRTSLDELPQLLNVLAGDMSLVGPRPPIPAEVDKYEDWHLKRLSAAPGMTGLWQVSGRSELPFDEMVLLDIYYIENWTLGLDIQILLRTIIAVISGRGAY